MTAFTALWLLTGIVNIVYAACLTGLAVCCWMGARILWWDHQQERRTRHVSAHPSSNVTVLRPPAGHYDWETEGTA